MTENDKQDKRPDIRDVVDGLARLATESNAVDRLALAIDGLTRCGEHHRVHLESVHDIGDVLLRIFESGSVPNRDPMASNLVDVLGSIALSFNRIARAYESTTQRQAERDEELLTLTKEASLRQAERDEELLTLTKEASRGLKRRHDGEEWKDAGQ